MKVTYLPESGTNFITYEVLKSNIDFNDGDLMFNVAKKERDYEVVIDICQDYTGGLVMGTADGQKYVAQVVIPPRQYIEIEKENPAYMAESEDAKGTESKTIIVKEPVPFDIDRCELRLWDLEV